MPEDTKPEEQKSPEDKSPAGRKEIYSKTDKWLEWIEEWKKITVDTVELMKLKVKLPTIERLSLFLEEKLKADNTINENSICIDTIETYAKDEENKPEFFGALKWLKSEQKKRLLESGLSGDYNSTIAKLILSANHGMNEKTVQEQTHKFKQMGTIMIDGKEAKFKLGDNPD